MKRLLLIVAAFAAFAACKGGSDGAEESAEPTSYEVVGTVVGVKSEGRVLVIDHEKIEGFMDAMMMPFALDSVELGKGIKKDDRVRFTITEKAGDWPITEITKIAKPKEEPAPAE
jgi:Cu/Ag efflux protein CusF